VGFISLLLIALGLSMDAFAVSVSNGVCYRGAGWRQAIQTGLVFGGFQAAMPLIGYFAGRSVSQMVESFDHWIAFGLLFFIGISMLREAGRSSQREEEVSCLPRWTLKNLIIQGVATSIDAFAVGISLALINTNIWLAIVFIGFVTFVCCVIGLLAGRRFGSYLRGKAEIAGGLILIGIGFKILFSHLFG
jgi:putative Mn2+ efflux pump MntP